MDAEPGEVVFFAGHPSWLSFTRLLARGLLGALAAGAIAGLASAISAGHVQVGWVIAAVAAVFLVLFVIAALRRVRTTYAITSRRLTIQTGLLSRDLHQTRLERVQNVTATQSLAQRVLHIGTVTFDTAGEAEYDFAFRGVENPRAIVRTVDRALHELPGAGPGVPARL